MSWMRDSCSGMIWQEQRQDLTWRVAWIIGREKVRSSDPSKVPIWDTFAAVSYPRIAIEAWENTSVSDLFEKLGPGLEEFVPGWSNDDCKLYQQELACFAAWFVRLSPDSQDSIVAAMQAAGPTGALPTLPNILCAPATAADAIYSQEFPPQAQFPPVGLEPKKSNALLWGLGAVAVVGAGFVVWKLAATPSTPLT